MPQVKVMSWNIRDFGTTKLHRRGVIPFIAMVIDLSEAGIVGIMEVVGEDGHQVLQSLLNELNTRRPAQDWQGVISEPLFDRNSEQYLYLWDTSQEISADAFQFMTPGIISENAFDFMGWDPEQNEEVMRSLMRKGFIRETYFLHVRRINELENGLRDLSFLLNDSGVMMDDDELLVIQEVLIAHRNLGVNDIKTRAPFQALFRIGPDQLKLPVVLLHAPSPDDPWKPAAINVLSNIEMLLNFPVAIVMGDFNVAHNEFILSKMILVNGESLLDANGTVVLKGAFEPLEDFGFEEVLNQPTSLKMQVKKGVYRLNHYDRFFLKEEPESDFTFEEAEVHDVVRLIYRSGQGNEDAEYSDGAMHMKYRPHHWPQNEIGSLSEALAAFRLVSDHLPIIITLNY